jgi:hypothetical protein
LAFLLKKNKINLPGEFIADEEVRLIILIIPVEVDVDWELCNMPSQIHADEDVSGTHDIKKV